MRVLAAFCFSLLLCAAVLPRAAAEAPQDLSVYAGLYPGEEVEGISFLEHPAVRAAAEKAVSDAAVLKWVLSPEGPKTPIAAKGNLLLSWGCETHHCGQHNWSLLITQDGSEAELCYFDADEAPGTRWFSAGQEPKVWELECPAK